MKDKLLQRIKDIELKIADLTEERRVAKQQLVELIAEFKIGDRVIIDGSQDTAIYELTSIRPGYGIQPDYYGSKIKKDGTPGARVSKIFIWHGQKLVKASK